MPFCTKCGTTVTQSMEFCPECGTKLSYSNVTFPRDLPSSAQNVPPVSRTYTPHHHYGRYLLLIIFLLVFFLLPIVPYTFSSASVFGLAGVQVTAQVSLSYALFHCGYVANPSVSGSFFGAGGTYT